MDEALIIFDYLPISYKNTTENEYISFLWESFLTNYNSQKYPFAFLSFHMLFMCFVYFEIWQIKENCYEDFQKGIIGFGNDLENKILYATTPFEFSQIQESPVFRFFKLIGMSNSEIGKCTKIVKDRNEAAHSNGNIFYKYKDTLDNKINEILICVELIQSKSTRIIEKSYNSFLVNSKKIGEREYLDDKDQTREVFVHKNYLSIKDINTALNCDISFLSIDPDFSNIVSLVNVLRNEYFPVI